MKKYKMVLKKILDSIYPITCPICHQIVKQKGFFVCPSCLSKVRIMKEPRCKQCGKQIENIHQEYCFDCEKGGHFYQQGIGVLAYDKVMQLSIAKWKYHGRREYINFYVRIITAYSEIYIKRWNIDVIIPVPLHKTRYRKRGFNQALDLAKGIGKHFGILVDENYILRVANTTAQKKLDHSLRFENMKRAFTIPKLNLKYKKILIVDDIYTTGSTIDAMSKCLMENEKVEIYFLTLCIGKGFN